MSSKRLREEGTGNLLVVRKHFSLVRSAFFGCCLECTFINGLIGII